MQAQGAGRSDRAKGQGAQQQGQQYNQMGLWSDAKQGRLHASRPENQHRDIQRQQQQTERAIGQS